MPTNKIDEYSNVILADVTQSAANTLTFEELNLGFNIFDKYALLLQRWEVLWGISVEAEIATNADSLSVAICADNTPSNLAFGDRRIIDTLRLQIQGAVTPVTRSYPLMKDYTSLSGGGLLLIPKPFYLAVDSTGFAAAATVNFRLYFVIVPLKDADYLELLEARRIYP